MVAWFWHKNQYTKLESNEFFSPKISHDYVIPVGLVFRPQIFTAAAAVPAAPALPPARLIREPGKRPKNP